MLEGEQFPQRWGDPGTTIGEIKAPGGKGENSARMAATHKVTQKRAGHLDAPLEMDSELSG